MSITSFTLKSATTQSQAPFSLGHAFKKGDVPAGSQVVGSISEMQVVPKNTWPDGSLKFAIISGRASLVANTALTVTLSIGIPSAGTALTTTDLKATGITVSTDAGSFGSVSWSTTDWDSPFQSWVSGPKMSSWIYRKSVGSDPHLVAWLEVRLYSGGEVNVLPWIENGYFRVAAPTNKSDTYAFTLGGTSRYSGAIDLKHHQRTVLINGTALSYWLGAEPGVTPLVDPTYMQATEMVPSYSAVLPAGGGNIPAQAATYTPLQQGNFDYSSDSMPSSGYQRPIGLLPEHDVLYLVSNATDRPALYASVVRNGYSAGRYCIHFRDETTQRPPAFSTYPTTVLNGGTESGIKDMGASTTSSYTPVPTGGNGPAWDASHSPSVGYMAYLLTGRFYFKEETQFATTANHFTLTDWVRGGGNGTPAYTPRAGFSGASGICNSMTQTRQGAWRFRTLAQALAATPDTGDALRSELIASVEANCEYFHQIYVAQSNNPFGIIEPAADEIYTDVATDRRMIPIWQQDFGTAAWGMALAFDMPISSTAKTKMAAFFAWKAKSVVHRLGTTSGYRFERAGVYEYSASPSTTPNFQSGAGPWYADDAAAYTGTSVGPQNITPTVNALYYNTTDYGPAEKGVWANLIPAIAYAVRHGATGADAAYTRMTGASNYSTLSAGFNANPVWSVSPASVTSPPPPAVLDPSGITVRVDSASLITGKVVCGNRAYGVLASVVPSTGRDGSAAGYNWLSLPTDANKQVRFVPEPLPSGMFMNEDGSFKYTGANTTVTMRGYVDGVDVGTAPIILNVTLVPVTITCAVGNANAAGRTASISTTGSVTINCVAGNANAAGSTATITVGVGTSPVTITCTVGNANASGASASVDNQIGNVTITTSVGGALAQGLTALVIMGSGGIGIGDRLEIIWSNTNGRTDQINRVRGDTYADQGVISSKTNGLSVDLSGSTLTMTLSSVRNPADDSTQIYQLNGIMIDAVNGVVGFAPNAQQSDIVGLFYYDVQLVDVSGIVRTLVKDVYVYEEDITKN